MNIRKTVRGVSRTVGHVATATTAAAGAISEAAINGVVGGVTGAATGAKHGLSTGSKSTPAAALTIGALGVIGLVDWPILLAVGGSALLLRRVNQKPDPVAPAAKAKLATTSAAAGAGPKKPAAVRKPATKKSTGRRAGAAELHSTH